MRSLCIYHGNCADGFAAAWVVREHFRRLSAPYNEVDFHAGVYQQAPPPVDEREVIIVDFSYKRSVLLDIASRAESVLVIDHHKTSAEDLAGKLGPNVRTYFDMSHSGAMLAWKYFFGGERAPRLLEHIEDRDLWRFALEGTREIQASVFSYPYDFDVWDRLMYMPVDQLRSDGAAIERKHFKDVRELLGVVTRRMVIAGHNVPIANLPYTYVSDAAHELAKEEPFAGCYWDTPAGRVFGLRSTEAGLDVSQVAKHYGGGGHAHAAGFTVPYDVASMFEVQL